MVDIFCSFLTSMLAGVAANYIFQYLQQNGKKNQE